MNWYTRILKIYGVILMGIGFAFFALVFPMGAPLVPWGGLLVALIGAWIGFSKSTDSHRREEKTD